MGTAARAHSCDAPRVRARQQRGWAELDHAEQLADAGTTEGLREAIDIVTRVRDQADQARGGALPGPADEGSWAQWTVLMTRASALLMRFRRAARDVGAAGEARTSEVRVRAPTLAGRVLVVEPSAPVRRQLAEEAKSSGVELLFAERLDEVPALRAREALCLIACRFPVDGVTPLVEALHRERAPVALITADVARAVATFGVQMPLVPEPVQLTKLLEAARDIAIANASPRVIVELPAAVSPRDPRRE